MSATVRKLPAALTHTHTNTHTHTHTHSGVVLRRNTSVPELRLECGGAQISGECERARGGDGAGTYHVALLSAICHACDAVMSCARNTRALSSSTEAHGAGPGWVQGGAHQGRVHRVALDFIGVISPPERVRARQGGGVALRRVEGRVAHLLSAPKKPGRVISTVVPSA